LVTDKLIFSSVETRDIKLEFRGKKELKKQREKVLGIKEK